MTAEEERPAGDLRTGQAIEATIEKAVYRGRGLARVGGRVVFVPRAHAGDRVRARVGEVHAGWAEASLAEILVPAAGRRTAPCPYVPRCGGCVYQDLGYEAQLAAKEGVLRESLLRAGAPWEGPIAVHSSPEEGWRLRASLHVAAGRDGLRLGLREEGTRRVVDLERCLQLSEGTNEAWVELRTLLTENPKLGARVNGIDLLESPDGGARVAAVTTTLAPRQATALLRASPPERLTGLGVEVGRGRLHWLQGTPFVEMNVGPLTLRVHVRSFFQANRFLYESLASTVSGLLPGKGRVLDLYAGVGLFALPLAARDGGEVVAVERALTAVEDARANVRRNRLEGVRIVPTDVRQALAATRPEPGERIVLDPPRTGLEKEVVALVADRRPAAVVYVSCDPPTLGRDLARFAARGYRPDTVRLFDLFPDTFHLETVVRLRPA
ncbi:MAG: class I SAM-dependent RNA methyltransferase [Acidobacteria bacterium]|nr:class I SAM-dependent RNA methyltransferase [Acidobacteriota bacterium]